MSEDRPGTEDGSEEAPSEERGTDGAEERSPQDGDGSERSSAEGQDRSPAQGPSEAPPTGAGSHTSPSTTSGATEGSDAARGAGSSEEAGQASGAQAVTRARTDDPDPVDEEPVPDDVRTYDRFQKVDRASYDRVNEFLRDRTYITAREWAIARLCADFRTATGVEMTKIGEHLPELVPFMTDTYTPQAVNQARSAFERKVRMAGATFLYGAMSGFFTADELDDLMYEVTEVAKFLLEVEGVELAVEEELDAEDRISAVMREVRQASEELRFDEVACPHCGEAYRPESAED